MSAQAPQQEQNASEFITIRIPADLAAFVNQQASVMCNSKAGVIRFAVSQLRAAVEAEEQSRLRTSAVQPEEVAA